MHCEFRRFGASLIDVGLCAVAKMVDMYPSDDATCASLNDVLAHAGRVDTLAASWLPLAGPTCTDEQREGVKGDLLRELQALNERLASSEYLMGGDVSFGDIAMLPNVLSLFQYVLGEDVRNEFGNISAWVGRVCSNESVSSVVGTCLMFVDIICTVSFPSWTFLVNHCPSGCNPVLEEDV